MVVACPTEIIMDSDIARNTTQTTILPRFTGDDDSQRCFTSGMDVINMFSYKPVRATFTK